MWRGAYLPISADHVARNCLKQAEQTARNAVQAPTVSQTSLRIWRHSPAAICFIFCDSEALNYAALQARMERISRKIFRTHA
jgi:hypothetical protein